ncbi:MAG: class I SAM-dependent methyltransferase [bacterium]
MPRNYSLKTTFNSEAELYESIRPTYPEELFEDIIKHTQVDLDSKLLEIGPGTGQATRSFAKRGYDITAVELGEDLANVARKVLSKFKKVRVITSPFEDVELTPNSFDLIYSATAFHWVKPEVKFTKTFNLLVKDGCLAIIDTRHVSDEVGDDFFIASQPIYEKYKPGGKYDKNFKLPIRSDLKADKVDETLFKLVSFNSFPINIKYSGKEYADLQNTYSPVIALPSEQREGFLREIQMLIDNKFGGSILKPLAMTLTIVKKVA